MWSPFIDAQPLDQAAVIPYRWQRDQLQFCLITTRNKRKWGFPKGNIDPGDTLIDTAHKEAFEEAGIRGDIHELPIGFFSLRKNSAELAAVAFLMQVQHIEQAWPEGHLRRRSWKSLSAARARIGRAELVQMLDIAYERLTTPPV